MLLPFITVTPANVAEPVLVKLLTRVRELAVLDIEREPTVVKNPTPENVVFPAIFNKLLIVKALVIVIVPVVVTLYQVMPDVASVVEANTDKVDELVDASTVPVVYVKVPVLYITVPFNVIVPAVFIVKLFLRAPAPLQTPVPPNIIPAVPDVLFDTVKEPLAVKVSVVVKFKVIAVVPENKTVPVFTQLPINV